MKRLVFAILTFFLLSASAKAAHIIGGEMRYVYLGFGSAPNSKQYRIVMILFKGDDPLGAPLAGSNVVAIYNNDNGQKIIRDNYGTTSCHNCVGEGVKRFRL